MWKLYSTIDCPRSTPTSSPKSWIHLSVSTKPWVLLSSFNGLSLCVYSVHLFFFCLISPLGFSVLVSVWLPVFSIQFLRPCPHSPVPPVSLPGVSHLLLDIFFYILSPVLSFLSVCWCVFIDHLPVWSFVSVPVPVCKYIYLFCY